MFDTDLTRIGELFSAEVGSENIDTSFEGLLSRGIKKYLGRNKQFDGIKSQVKYFGEDHQYTLEFDVFKYAGKVDVSQVLMRGVENNFEALLNRAQGTLVAEYGAFKWKKFETKNNHGTIRTKNLTLWYIVEHDAPLIKRAQIQVMRGPPWKRRLLPEDICYVRLQKEEMDLLSNADSLKFHDAFHVRGEQSLPLHST